MSQETVITLVSMMRSFIPFIDPITNVQRGFVLSNNH